LRIGKQLAYTVPIHRAEVPLRQQFLQKLAKISKSLGLKHLLVLAVETNIFNVFRKPDLWQDIN